MLPSPAIRSPRAWARWSTPTPRRPVDGGIEKVDDFTIKLNLPKPDISLIAGMADYPALIMHRSYEGDDDPMKALAITTGPCELVSWDAETGAEVRRKDKPWWKGDFYLDGINWIDYGSDPNAMLSAFESGEIDTDHETAADTRVADRADGADEFRDRHRLDHRRPLQCRQRAL